MIRDNDLQTPDTFTFVKPAGAMPLPGIDSILARPSAGGAPPPTASERLIPIKRLEYLESEYVPAIQPHTYVTNPRKDGTKPRLNPIQELNIAAARAMGPFPSFPSGKESQNDTGKQDAPITGLHWAALLVLAGIAFLVFGRKR